MVLISIFDAHSISFFCVTLFLPHPLTFQRYAQDILKCHRVDISSLKASVPGRTILMHPSYEDLKRPSAVFWPQLPAGATMVETYSVLFLSFFL